MTNASPAWQPYPLRPTSTVLGDLRLYPALYSPQLDNRRDILCWLPPGYDAGRKRYPVLYMHDGQNLFDAAASYAGEWRVDETMLALCAEGLEAIVVGIPNAGLQRPYEYSYHIHSRLGGGGAPAYIRFLVETVKPLVDACFRTRPQRRYTGLLGSSLGGLVSLYGYFSGAPQTFGLAGIFSPALWWSETTIFSLVENAPRLPGRIYLDVGGKEIPALPERQEAYAREVHLLANLLRRKGYTRRNLRFVYDPEGGHNEANWAARLPGALRFLLG